MSSLKPIFARILLAALLASFAVCGAVPGVGGTSPGVARADTALPRADSESAGIDSPPAVEPIEIEVWWGLSGPLDLAFEQEVARFNDLQDEIVVALRVFPGYAELHRELAKALGGDDLPDAAIVEIHQVASFAKAEQIQSLDALAKDDPSFAPDDLLPGILTNLRYRDKLYALPMNRSTPLLFYNKRRFAAAGLDVSKPPTTWQQVREMGRSLTSPDREQYGFLAASSPWMFESLVWSNGGQLFVDGRPTFAKTGAGPLQLWADMVHRDQTARFGARGDSFAEFTSGRAAMTVDSPAFLQAFISKSDFEVGTAALPRSEGGEYAVPTGGGGAVIPEAISPERKATVWKFLTWFTSTRQTARWSRQTGYIPVRTSACNLLRAEGFYDDHPEFEVAIEQLKVAREAPPQWFKAWKTIGDRMRSVVCDDAPARQALEGAEKDIARMLDSQGGPAP